MSCVASSACRLRLPFEPVKPGPSAPPPCDPCLQRPAAFKDLLLCCLPFRGALPSDTAQSGLCAHCRPSAPHTYSCPHLPADTYSFGMCLWELLALTLPWGIGANPWQAGESRSWD